MTEKVYIESDELYPYFTASSGRGTRYEVEADMPDGFMARIEAAEAAFFALQDEMRKACDAKPNPLPSPADLSAHAAKITEAEERGKQ